jgi:pilus assembly protein CpaF
MFSRYKKPDRHTGSPPPSQQEASAPAPSASAEPARPTPRRRRRRKPPRSTATTKKAQGTLGRIKIEMHRASSRQPEPVGAGTRKESELRAEIGSITSESLAEMGVVLNREDRQT